MPDSDSPALLCTLAQLQDGGFGDLVSQYPASGLTDALAEGTRACEDQADRRFAPFTVTETVYAYGINPDEYTGPVGLPVSIQGTIGLSEAMSLNVGNLVRRAWVAEYPPRYPDLWTTSPAITVTVIRSIGGSSGVQSGQILEGPDNTGHIMFQLGTFIPVGSMLQITYSGGYTVATPAGLTRAARFFAASVIVRELDPGSTDHNPDQLWNDGMRWLLPFGRDGSAVRLWAQGARVR